MLDGGHLTHAEHRGVMSLSVRGWASAGTCWPGAGRGGGRQEKAELDTDKVFRSSAGSVTPEGQGRPQGETWAWAPRAGTLGLFGSRRRAELAVTLRSSRRVPRDKKGLRTVLVTPSTVHPPVRVWRRVERKPEVGGWCLLVMGVRRAALGLS